MKLPTRNGSVALSVVSVLLPGSPFQIVQGADFRVVVAHVATLLSFRTGASKRLKNEPMKKTDVRLAIAAKTVLQIPFRGDDRF